MDKMKDSPAIEGDLYLYRQPELLEHARHGGMGLIANDRPFEFAADARVVPIVASEILSVQKHYPVVFSSWEDPVLLAVVGIEGEGNLFVDRHGRWEAGCYIPAYIRSYPFGFAETQDNRIAIVIDTASPAVSDSPTEAFFDGDRLSEATQSKVDLFSQQVIERRKTREFCDMIVELGLLTGQQAARTVAGQRERLASYTAVDADRLRGLDAGQLWDVHTRGMLAVIYAHIFSLENWPSLIERVDARRGMD